MKGKNYEKNISRSGMYSYSSRLEREETIAFLYDYAAKHKRDVGEYWKKMKRYYDGRHDISLSTDAFSAREGLPFKAAECTDGYIHVETQINHNVPDFEFSPRDRTDYDKAKQREKIVKYVVDNAGLEGKNSRNERRLNIYGSAIWKVCWDSGIRIGKDLGDVTVENPRPEEIITDPTACDVDSCEYIAYVYPMHKMRAKRVFGADIKSEGSDFSEYLCDDMTKNPLGYVSSDRYDTDDDTVNITEWWYRQPSDGSADITRLVNGEKRVYRYEWKAGDIALSVLINGKEVRYIPKYWKNTDCRSFPFVVYSKIPNEKSIWGKSELEMLIPLIDAKDRELCFAQLNGAYSSNDIIVMEENALSDGESLDNSPGAVWKLRPGMMGKVSRLGNLSSASAALYEGSSFWQSMIESTTGIFEVNQGKEPTNVTTATGIALLNERAENRKSIKNIDRNAGFKRLYMLIDYTCLENYNDGRIIRMGLEEGEDVVYSFGGFMRKSRQGSYIPELDVTIHTGSAITNSKAFTVSALTSLIGTDINETNYRLVKAYVEAIGIPERSEICESLDRQFEKADINQDNSDSPEGEMNDE